jgi:predicted metal-dependent hydrolase
VSEREPLDLRDLLVRASDLFNRKLFFECHDLLEERWSGSRGEEREFLQALIHLSVGLYHIAAGNHVGARNLLERAISGLEPFAPERSGLDVSALLSRARVCLGKTKSALAGETIEWSADDVPEMRIAAV